METDWIIHTQLYDNLKKEKTLDVEKLNNIINKLIDCPFIHDLNELIMNEKIEILFENPKICEFFELVEFNKDKIASIHNKFINFAIKKTQNNFTFCDSYKNENGELYNFYKNMSLKTCFDKNDKCKDCYHACKNGHVECLKYKWHFFCRSQSQLAFTAAENGHLECLKYLHENGCFWWNLTCSYAAQNGHLECLKYAHENGCPWNEDTCANAALNGHLECLKYAHENDCPWNSNTCSNAALNGHLKCLKYAHENGCPWDIWTCSKAALNGHLECLKYAHKNGCYLNNHLFSKNKDCLKYIKKKTSLLSCFIKKIDNFFFVTEIIKLYENACTIQIIKKKLIN
ncbi:ankyrin repeat domain-containing protein [Bodo saltans virus]|uniref:Ankyrin repeat domain-containing protein n=1 Tax=Bodo saltans virus TaxID=2024608 RepID=A0A2H4UTI5_9VIRU|nr:ankyrin repeat domain-containing protein [Bodo saltans virus]ATZ80159.1 ankyrin repeat domain-containing protein [Bodo saltans virus]